MPPRKRVKELEPGVDASGSTAESVKKKQSNAGKSWKDEAICFTKSTLVGNRRLGNNGKLALLLEMPTEIFTEVSYSRLPTDDNLKCIPPPSFRSLAICLPEIYSIFLGHP